ncbi:hypothetical protein [Microbispora sp. NPDC049125]|uniref:AMIN-like domain-containing (lipo)protein n=1 Tax=Microbispora sp. NPDC049125 TaxID=3154929 RepID=UPI00346780BC
MIAMRSLIGEAPVPAAVPVLAAVRATHHRGLDRLVFEFRGGLPEHHAASYVKCLVADGTGETVAVAGDAILRLRLFNACGGGASGAAACGATRSTYALPAIIQVVEAGSAGSVLTFGVGLAKRVRYRMYTLNNPSRVVVDFPTPYWTVNARVRFLDTPREPRTATVSRPVIPPSVARGALQRLFAGPTREEQAAGLRFTDSHATGFSKLKIRGGVAHVHLTGDVRSDGATFTVADEITATLKRFPAIRWVKIYDADGRTERPAGRTDSIPECLEPGGTSSWRRAHLSGHATGLKRIRRLSTAIRAR